MYINRFFKYFIAISILAGCAGPDKKTGPAVDWFDIPADTTGTPSQMYGRPSDGYGDTPESDTTHHMAVMLPLSAVSAVFYLWGGNVSLGQALPYIPGGIAGALIGVVLLRRVSPSLLRRLFGGVAVYSGLRILLR